MKMELLELLKCMLRKKPQKWYDQLPGEEYEIYIDRINRPDDYNLDCTVNLRRRAARLKREEASREEKDVSCDGPCGPRHLYPFRVTYPKRKRQALGSSDSVRPIPVKYTSKSARRIFQQVATMLKRRVKLKRQVRVPRPL